jgi:hypothetical protein
MFAVIVRSAETSFVVLVVEEKLIGSGGAKGFTFIY